MKTLLALLLLCISCYAHAAELLEKHAEVIIDQSNYKIGEREIFFSNTKDAYIKSYAVSALGVPLGQGQYGFAYLWRDVDHYALILNLDERTGRRREEKDFGSDYILVPAGFYLCLMWSFSAVNGPLWLFADITYFLAP